jgi:glycerophosphoryl diester phosphodiesterase
VRVVALLAPLLLVLALVPAAAAQNPWLEQRVLNIAHQGGEDEFPSNTLYAFKRSVKAGADMLELDVGVTRDGKVVVSHDVTLDRTTNGKGRIERRTLRRIRKLDAAYWFARGRGDAYPTKAEAESEYVANAEVLAPLLRKSGRRDLIVTSFKQQAVDRFHELAPAIGTAPGIDGAAAFLLAGGSPGDGVVAFQMPITFRLGETTVAVTTPENVAKAHAAGYAWHTWLSDDDDSPATWHTLLDQCVDGVMTARPTAFEEMLRAHHIPEACG